MHAKDSTTPVTPVRPKRAAPLTGAVRVGQARAAMYFSIGVTRTGVNIRVPSIKRLLETKRQRGIEGQRDKQRESRVTE